MRTRTARRAVAVFCGALCVGALAFSKAWSDDSSRDHGSVAALKSAAHSKGMPPAPTIGAVREVSASKAGGSTLECWNVYYKGKGGPLMTADILSDSSLKNIRFSSHAANSGNVPKDTPGRLKGAVETSNHSPYKGNNKFELKEGETLILPTSLSAASLKKALHNGVGKGMGGGENGVIIGYFEPGDDAGNHYSIRLRCVSAETGWLEDKPSVKR